jgi:hypothetical protein
MDEDKSIFTAEGDKIKFADKSPSLMIDKPILVFGAPNTGKTTVVEELIILTKDYIPNHIIIAPITSQDPYTEKFPRMCIKEDMTKKLFVNIWKRQENITKIYNMANNIEILGALFKKINNPRAQALVGRANMLAENHINSVNNNTGFDFGQKKSQIDAIKDKRKKEIIKIYKSTIRACGSELNVDELDPDAVIALKYMDINPKLMIVVDDCTEKLVKWMKMFKGEDNIFHNVFFRGRHNHISMIIISHNDRFIPPELRNAASRIIYTDPQTFKISLERTTNGFSKEDRKLGLRCAKKIFANLPGVKNFQKLCYIKSDFESPFQYTIAEIYPAFSLISGPLKVLSDHLEAKDREKEKENNSVFVNSLIGKGSN